MLLFHRVLAAALCVQHPPPGPAPLPATAALRGALGAAREVLMSATRLDGFSSGVQQFQGRMLGVRARVALDMDTRKARIELLGAPMGGYVQGVGWLTDPKAEAGKVVVDREFARKLARRFVSITHAGLNRRARTVSVTVTVPVFGQQTLVLQHTGRAV